MNAFPIQAQFVISNTDYRKCPDPDCPEFAFIGRSNVGKSSLINMLCQAKDLAKTSSKPGKTQLINHFSINQKQWYLVDLPGYGYAKTAKSIRDTFQGMIRSYLENRENLYCTFVLIDSRLEPQKIDLQFLEFLGEKGIPFALVFTKTDKLGTNQIQKNIELFKKTMQQTWEELPPSFISSSVNRIGRDEILSFIHEVIKNTL